MQKSLLKGTWTQLYGRSVWKQPACNDKNPPAHFFII